MLDYRSVGTSTLRERRNLFLRCVAFPCSLFHVVVFIFEALGLWVEGLLFLCVFYRLAGKAEIGKERRAGRGRPSQRGVRPLV